MNKILVLNHKSKLDIEEVKSYIKDIKDNIRNDLDVIVMPSMCYLPLFYGRYKFYLGSQNIGFTNSTGEVSINQIKSLNCKYVLIGHSERRILYNETYDIINKKIKLAIDNNIRPIVCIGETIEERKRRKTQDVLLKQIRTIFDGILVGEDIIIAYEPVWAIGTGIMPTVSEVKEIISLIKDFVYRKYGKNIKVIYGGSIDKSSVERFNSIRELDGFLIGGASTDKDKIIEIMNLI